MKRPTCDECSAFNALGNECRRHAPLAVPIQQPGGIAAAGIYPATRGDSWCLEHVPTIAIAAQH